MLAQQRQRLSVDRHPIPLDRSRSFHKPAAQQRMRQINARQHCEKHAFQDPNVAFAVTQNRGLFLGGPRRSAQDDGHHALLGGALDRVDAKIGCGRNQAGAMVPAVGAGAKFGKGVENVFRLRPAQRPKDAQLGRSVVCDEQHIIAVRERRLRFEFIVPQPPNLAAEQFSRHHADRARTFARSAGLGRRGVATEMKFGIARHDVLEG